jgi:hypothetical protein
MYKPNFCAECGERIARARWRIYTSRRFCTGCDGRFRRARILLPLIAAVSLFAVGLVAGRFMRPQPAPLMIERGELPLAPAVTTARTTSEVPEAEGEAVDASSSATQPPPEPKYGPDGTATERPTESDEAVSICGARTQKGTPCRRRVRGTGRCWQHRPLS